MVVLSGLTNDIKHKNKNELGTYGKCMKWKTKKKLACSRQQ